MDIVTDVTGEVDVLEVIGRPNNNWTPNRYSGNKHDGSQDQRNDNNQQDVTCYRCNQVSHLAIGCRVDLSKDPLNCQESV